MTPRALAVRAPARNEKENPSQAPALSEVQSSRRVGGSPAKETPARSVPGPPAHRTPLYKRSAGAFPEGTGAGELRPRAGGHPPPGLPRLWGAESTEGRGGVARTEERSGEGRGGWLRHGAVAAVGSLKPTPEPHPTPGEPPAPLGWGQGSLAGPGSRGLLAAGLSAGSYLSGPGGCGDGTAEQGSPLGDRSGLCSLPRARRGGEAGDGVEKEI